MPAQDAAVDERVVPDRRVEAWSAVLLLLHVTLTLVIVVWHPIYAESADVARFVQIARAPGVAYRDFDVEYAPVETLVIRAFFDTSLEHAVGVTAVITLISDLALYYLLRRGWGDHTGAWYLTLSLPLMVFLPFRLDLFPVALVVAGYWASKRERERLGGGLVALAVLSKLWPLVVLPALFLSGRKRAFAWASGLSALGIVAWGVFGGIDSVRYVVSFRGASGWQVESTVGSVLSVLGGAMRTELGAVRVGLIPAWASAASATLGLLGVVAVWRKGHRGGVAPEGFPAVAAVAVVIAVSTVASAQYVAWLIPWGAIALAERRRTGLATALSLASVLAASVFLVYWGITGAETALAWMAFARALVVLAIPTLWFLEPQPLLSSPGQNVTGEGRASTDPGR